MLEEKHSDLACSITSIRNLGMGPSPGARAVRGVALSVLAALMFAGGIARADYESAVLDDEPIGYWRLNETDDEIAEDLGSLDSEGTYMGLVDQEAEGPPELEDENTAMFVGPEDGWVQTDAMILNDLEAFTMTLFINPEDRTANRIGLCGQNNAIEFGFINPTTLQIWTPAGGSLNVTYPFPSGEWHYIAVVGTGTELQMYLDGELAGSGGGVTANYGASTFGFNIGGGGVFDGAGNQFTGSIDEVALWDVALTVDQIEDHYAAAQMCPTAQRELSTSRYESGGTVSVTVSATNVTGAATITETFPMGWTVSNAGGGTVSDNTIQFDMNADGDVTYELTVPADFCEAAEITGTIAGGGDCSASLTGDSELNCVVFPTIGEYASVVLADEPIAYWTLDEVEGTTALNIGSLEEGADGTYTGLVDLEAEGSPLFPADNTGILVGPDDGSVQTGASILSGVAAFSMTLFINPEERTANRIGLCGQNDAIEFGFINPTTLQIWTPAGGSLNVDYPFPSGEWHYIAVVGTGEELQMYFDGELAGVGGAFTDNYGSSGFGFNIGGGGVFDGTGNQFTGSIDEVAVWDVALTPEQIEDHYAAAEADDVPLGAKLLPGDSNGDGTVNITDPVAALGFLFSGTQAILGCFVTDDGAGGTTLTDVGLHVLDWNGDGSHNISDPLGSLTFQFGSGAAHELGEECTVIMGDCEDRCQ